MLINLANKENDDWIKRANPKAQKTELAIHDKIAADLSSKQKRIVFKTLKDAETENSVLVSALDDDLSLVNHWYSLYDQSTTGRDSDKVKIAWALFKQEYEKDETGWKKKLK